MAKFITNTARTELAIVDALGAFSVATIHEAQDRTGLLATRLRPIYRPVRVAGNALTVEVAPGDNLSIHVAVELAQFGDILVVSPTSPCEDGYFGELLATSFRSRGVRALVIDAGVRDIAELTAMSFPVWSRVVSAQGTIKETPGNVQCPLDCAGTLINPGDVIIADDDGVVVVRSSEAEFVLARALERESTEGALRIRLANGEMMFESSALRARLIDRGHIYVDGPEN